MPKNRDSEFGHLDPEPMTSEAEAAPVKSGGPNKTVEQWAAAKGMLPEMLPPPPAAKGVIPEAPRHNAQFWRFAGARALMKWPEGAEVTEAEFDAAVEKNTNGVLR